MLKESWWCISYFKI